MLVSLVFVLSFAFIGPCAPYGTWREHCPLGVSPRPTSLLAIVNVVPLLPCYPVVAGPLMFARVALTLLCIALL